VGIGIKDFTVVGKQTLGAVKTIDLLMTNGQATTVTVEGSCIRYDGRVITTRNMLPICSKILRVAL